MLTCAFAATQPLTDQGPAGNRPGVTAKLMISACSQRRRRHRDYVFVGLRHHVAATLHFRSLVLLPAPTAGLRSPPSTRPRPYLPTPPSPASSGLRMATAGWEIGPRRFGVDVHCRLLTRPPFGLCAGVRGVGITLATEQRRPARRLCRTKPPSSIERTTFHLDRDARVMTRPSICAPPCLPSLSARPAHAAGVDHRSPPAWGRFGDTCRR